MNVSIVFPLFPPVIDGIGDHTANLARAMSDGCRVTVFTGAAPHSRVSGVDVRSVFEADRRKSAGNVLNALRETEPDWIILQYNPFSYGKWGFNLHLPRAVAEAARTTRSRLAVMVHEPFVPPESARFRVMRLWQKRQLDTLVRAADLVFFSITTWADDFQRIYPGKHIEHLPIGSNIPVVEPDREAVRANYSVGNDDVLLGLFGSGHPNRLFPFVHEAVRHLRSRNYSAPLLYVGGSSDKLLAEFGTTSFINAGKLSSDDVSKHLSAMDIYLCPFGKGVSSRRGSFMAGIEHGLACVTTHGSQSDDFLLESAGNAFLVAPDNRPDEFSRKVEEVFTNPDLRRQLGTEATKLYRDNFQWDLIASRALESMQKIESS